MLLTQMLLESDRCRKKRTSLGYGASYAAIPRPMYAQKQSHEGKASQMNGMPTPTSTPPPNMEHKQLVTQLNKTRLSEGSSSEEPSPRVLPTDPVGKPEVEALDDLKKEQVEDADTQREGDIYAEAVLACELSPPLNRNLTNIS